MSSHLMIDDNEKILKFTAHGKLIVLVCDIRIVNGRVKFVMYSATIEVAVDDRE